MTVLTLVLIFPVLSGCGSPGPAPDRSAALPERYRQAERRLEEAKGPGRDRKLCRAFAAVLRDLAARGDPVVHVAVTEVPDRRDPPEAAANLARWKEDAEFWRYGPDVLPQDAIFGKARRQRRAEAVLVHVRAVLKQVTDEELLPELGSGVLEVTEAVSVTLLPLARPLAALTTTTKVSVPPALIEVAVNLAVLPLLVLTKASGPPVCISETSVSPAGRASVSATEAASDGPRLVRVMV